MLSQPSFILFLYPHLQGFALISKGSSTAYCMSKKSCPILYSSSGSVGGKEGGGGRGPPFFEYKNLAVPTRMPDNLLTKFNLRK